MTFLAANNMHQPKVQISAQSAQQTGSTSAGGRVAVNGTTVTYTPSSSATTVCYEAAYYCERVNYITNVQNVHLEESTDGGSTWSEVNEKYRKNYGNGGQSYQSMRWYQHLVYFLPAWSGERQFRVAVGTSAGNRETYFHKLVLWDGAASSTDFTSVNVLMYSIL